MTAEDVIRRLADEQIADKDITDRSGWHMGGFTMGRLRHQEHDGYTTDGFAGRSVSFNANEASGVGFLAFSTDGFQANSRLTFSAYAGYSNLNIDLKPDQAIFGNAGDPGKASNGAILYGISLGYGVDSLYSTVTAAGFSGSATINDLQNGFRPEFGTDGYIVSAIIGNIFQLGNIGGHASFLTLEGGAKHVAFEGDDYLSQSGAAIFNMSFTQTTINAGVGLFQIHQVGSAIVRPYLRATVTVDVAYENESRIRDLNGANPETTSYDEASLRGTAELGMIVKDGDWTFSGAGYVELADDAEALGARIGASYAVPLR